MPGFLHRWLAHPSTRGLDVDDPRTTSLRRQIIRSKPFLKSLYEEWYRDIAAHFASDARVLELGTGAGFLKRFLPRLITSDVFPTPGVACVLDARSIALAPASLDGIVMTDVLHHLPDCGSFFDEAARVVRPGGDIVLVEPWNTPWSRWVYSHLHHEPFQPDARDWRFPVSGPLSGANGALPWIVFQRDRALFEERHSQWRIRSISPVMPVAYLLSGGVSLRFALSGRMYGLVRFLERHGKEASWAMFARIALKRQG